MTSLPINLGEQFPGARPRHGLQHLADEIDLRSTWLMLLRRKWLIAIVVLVPSVIAFLIIKQMPSLYTASAYVLVEPAPPFVASVSVNPRTGELELPPDRMQSEIQVIKSRDLIKRVVARLKLMEDPEFNPELRPHGPLRDVLKLDRVLPDPWVVWLEANLPQFVADGLNALKSKGEPPPPGINMLELSVLDTFDARLDTSQVATSRALQVSFSSYDPVKAAKIANTIVDLYIVSQLEADLEITRRTNAWLSDQITQLRDQVSEAESAVADYRARSGLLKGRDVTFAAQQVAEMSTELSKVRADRALAEGRLGALEGSAGRGQEELAGTEGLEEVQSLRVMEAEAAQRLAALSKDLGRLHPKYVAAEAELTQLHQRVAEAQARVLGAARSDAMTARLREESLTADIDRLKGELAQANEAEVRLNELQREADANRALFETFLARSKEQTMEQTFERPNAKILASADPPVDPSYPPKALFMILFVFVFGIAGVAVAFLVEASDRGFRSGEQIELVTGQRALGLVPALGGTGRPEDYVLKRPTSAYSESIRNLYAGIMLPHRENPPKLILITSSLPKEGKTTVTMSLARLLALSGKSVLVVDCDLRRPSVHKSLGASPEPGLADLLLKREPLERVIQQDHASPARFIGAGAPHRSTATLLSSDEMREALRQLREMFDVVLLDSPPTLAVSDPRLLATLVDKTVFLVRWAHGDRRAATEALKQLLQSGADIAGVALTRVDLKRHARYGFSDSSYYGRAVRYYYN
jgi:capsular exopolysaccharide synthesis family protein